MKGRGAVLVLLLALAFDANAQQLESSPPPQGTSKPAPYLPPNAVDYHLILAPPPEVGSAQDNRDVADETALQSGVGNERWQEANQDAAFVYPRFSEALGRTLDRATLPHTIALLNRAIRDVAGPAFAAKQAFHRPRPFQRFQLTRVCGEEKAPVPDANPVTGSSYPSGHSAYGWTVALVLARVAPDRAPQLLSRAAEYADSRLICGIHFPSDVEAGRVLATAVAEKLAGSPAFRRDLACAQAEFAGHAATCATRRRFFRARR